MPLTFGNWYELSVRLVGSDGIAYLNGKELFKFKDAAIDSGFIKISTYNMDCSVDDVLVAAGGTTLIDRVIPMYFTEDFENQNSTVINVSKFDFEKTENNTFVIQTKDNEILTERHYADFDMQFSFQYKPSLNNTDGEIYIGFHRQDEKNQLVFSYHPLTQVVCVSKQTEGEEEILSTTSASLLPNRLWHTMGIRCSQQQMTYYLDGVVIFTTQTNVKRDGFIAIGSKNIDMWIDDIMMMPYGTLDYSKTNQMHTQTILRSAEEFIFCSTAIKLGDGVTKNILFALYDQYHRLLVVRKCTETVLDKEVLLPNHADGAYIRVFLWDNSSLQCLSDEETIIIVK